MITISNLLTVMDKTPLIITYKSRVYELTYDQTNRFFTLKGGSSEACWSSSYPYVCIAEEVQVVVTRGL